MIILPFTQREQHKEQLFATLAQEKLICYPTDSLYGLGGIATPQVIASIDACKGRQTGKHYSLIAPDRERITTHFISSPQLSHQREEWYTLYGPITVLLPKKDPNRLSWISPTPLIGVRYFPHHPIQKCIAALQQPIVSTSCNRSGEKPITHPDHLLQNPLLSSHISYFLTNGSLEGPASTLIDTGPPLRAIQRK